MRLINYEEYKNKLLEVRNSIPLTVPAATYELMREKPYTQGMAMRGGIRKALKCLEECQNVSDVAPVAHGRWIEKTVPEGCRYFECSNCGAHENKHTAIKGYYCWRCGAKMDGGEDND